MVRTQIYLTERQRHELAAIAYTVWKKQSELIREAVDRLIKEEASGRGCIAPSSRDLERSHGSSLFQSNSCRTG